MAERHGTMLHPAAQWKPLSGGSEASEPPTGSLDQLTLASLVAVLTRHTGTPDECWLGLWVGYGASPRAWWSHPTFRASTRELWLFRSTLARVVEHSVAFATNGYPDDSPWLRRGLDAGDVQSPQLWWPHDRAWAVCSEIDYDSTVVGCSAALARQLVGTSGIECLRVDPATSLYAGADQVNGT